MTIADAYRRLGAVLSGLESQGIDVAAVTPDETEDAEPLVVDLRITVPADKDAPEVRLEGSPPPQEVGADGGTRAASASAPESTPSSTESAPEPGSESEQTGEAAGGPAGDATDEEFPCAESGCSAGFDSAAALTVHRFAAHDRPEGPLHQHEPALRAAYEAYDSFSSMTDALGVDVTAQTVRRNMMKAGIHTPETDADEADDGESASGERGADDTSGADDAVQDSASSTTEEQPVTDGSGSVAASAPAEASPEPPGESEAAAEPGTDPAEESLPDGVTVEGLREAVVEGGSLRAVARELDRPSGEVRTLLDELGLLEQVHGRVATRPDRGQRAAAFDDWLETYRSGGPSVESGRTDS